MATATIAGTITAPLATGGPDASLVVGSPSITPSSSSGPTLTFNEKSSNTYSVTVLGGAFTVPFGTISAADIFYLGVDQASTVILNGGAETITLEAGAFILLYKAGITAATVTATAIDAVVEVFIAGD